MRGGQALRCRCRRGNRGVNKSVLILYAATNAAAAYATRFGRGSGSAAYVPCFGRGSSAPADTSFLTDGKSAARLRCEEVFGRHSRCSRDCCDCFRAPGADCAFGKPSAVQPIGVCCAAELFAAANNTRRANRAVGADARNG